MAAKRLIPGADIVERLWRARDAHKKVQSLQDACGILNHPAEENGGIPATEQAVLQQLIETLTDAHARASKYHLACALSATAAVLVRGMRNLWGVPGILMGELAEWLASAAAWEEDHIPYLGHVMATQTTEGIPKAVLVALADAAVRAAAWLWWQRQDSSMCGNSDLASLRAQVYEKARASRASADEKGETDADADIDAIQDFGSACWELLQRDPELALKVAKLWLDHAANMRAAGNRAPRMAERHTLPLFGGDVALTGGPASGTSSAPVSPSHHNLGHHAHAATRFEKLLRKGCGLSPLPRSEGRDYSFSAPSTPVASQPHWFGGARQDPNFEAKIELSRLRDASAPTMSVAVPSQLSEPRQGDRFEEVLSLV